jgi:DNA-binding transcriptional LysR family regulator
MSVDQLRAFLAVAEELHFGRAAKRLHLATSAVSRKIKELESALGVTVFERDTRNVQLSLAGAELLPTVRDLVNKLDELRWLVPRADEPVTDPVHVGLGCGTHPQHRAALFQALRSVFPDRQIIADVGVTGPLLDGLQRGELICTTLHRPFPSESLGIYPLSDDEIGVAVSAAHPLASRGHLTVSLIRNLQFVEHCRAPVTEEALSAIGIRNIVNINSDFITDVATTVATNTDYFTITVLDPANPLHRACLDPGLVILPCIDLRLHMITDLAWLESREATEPELKSLVTSLPHVFRDASSPFASTGAS